MRPEQTSRWFWRLEWTLWAMGAGCLAWYGLVAAEARFYQRVHRSAVEGMQAVRQPPSYDVGQLARPSATRLGDPIGILEIPRLHVSVAVVNGDDDDMLRVAVGHLPDTPLPWEAGNSALAAHRDTFFRPLENIHENDEVRFATPRGDFLYRVRRTLIVGPEDVWVLAPTLLPSLTLVTCYPFSLVGHAQQRFIVQAERVAPAVP